MSFRIRTRLTLWYVALLGLVLLAIALYLVVQLRAGLVEGVDHELETRAAQISLGLQPRCEGEFQDVSDASLIGLPRGESGAQLLSHSGTVLESSGDAAAEGPLLDLAQLRSVFDGATLRVTVRTGADLEPFRLLAVEVPSSTCPGALVVATSLDEVDRSVRQLAVLLGLAGPVALALAGLGGWWLARRALAPVTAMTREAQTIGIERLDERIDVPPSADELQHLAITLNAMLDRLARGVEDKRRFAADASHELRTPLAVMRTELAVSLRDRGLPPSARSALESAEEEVERMREIVENLLTLARADDGALDLLRGDAELRDIASAVVDATIPLARPAGVRLVVEGAPARCSVDRPRIEQVLTNLVSNAVAFSPAGGLVLISCWAREGEAGCTVTDNGPGVPPEIGARIFDRFVRGDPSRARDGGSGLGLAISREIVEAHGGRIWADQRAGSGGSFSFAVPSLEPVLHD